MPGQRGSERRKMAGAVLVRLPADLAMRVANAAEEADLTAAAYLRRLAAEATRARPELAAPVRAYRKARPPAPQHVVEVVRLREAVGELAGGLVQAAVRTREAGHADLHAAVEAVLPGVRAAALDLDALKKALLEEDRG
ncbi:hypothetical protein SAMN02982917_1873 [Azospirillum oryzae]|uniref:Uncharacterized protein n=1 Tax=Azospirillum oryzae TaxID=286727 RepID=A0A1X7EMJ6_9PROT|nr:hypothetical protein [Azospirillum oryzae]SMF36678.1 hypothetical protein SAMN02982917_1873 [Azospirillum oryzae]